MEMYRLGLGIMVLFSLYLQIHHVARYHVGYKHYQIVYSRYGLSFGSHIRYCHLLQQGKLFSLSCHFYTKYNKFAANLRIILEITQGSNQIYWGMK